MTDRIRTRFLVIGSGVAGLHTAWRASAHGSVTVLTKRTLFDSATAYAQGGIAAALGAGDSPGTVLDPRLGNTHWGRLLLRGLPPFRIVVGDRAPDRERRTEVEECVAAV